jgi:hypothetical protein
MDIQSDILARVLDGARQQSQFCLLRKNEFSAVGLGRRIRKKKTHDRQVFSGLIRYVGSRFCLNNLRHPFSVARRSIHNSNRLNVTIADRFKHTECNTIFSHFNSFSMNCYSSTITE